MSSDGGLGDDTFLSEGVDAEESDNSVLCVSPQPPSFDKQGTCNFYLSTHAKHVFCNFSCIYIVPCLEMYRWMSSSAMSPFEATFYNC